MRFQEKVVPEVGLNRLDFTNDQGFIRQSYTYYKCKDKLLDEYMQNYFFKETYKIKQIPLAFLTQYINKIIINIFIVYTI